MAFFRTVAIGIAVLSRLITRIVLAVGSCRKFFLPLSEQSLSFNKSFLSLGLALFAQIIPDPPGIEIILDTFNRIFRRVSFVFRRAFHAGLLPRTDFGL